MRPFSLFLILACIAAPVQAQFFLTCQTGSLAELEHNIAAHEEHSYRLNRKFLDEYYYEGALPASFRPASLEDVRRYLRALNPDRRAALLFYAHNDDRFCVWLLSPRSGLTSHVDRTRGRLFRSLGERLTRALGVDVVSNSRTPRRRGVHVTTPQMPAGSLAGALRLASHLLLPERILQAMADDSLDAVAIVPVSPIAVIPFGALLIEDTPLVDLMAVSIVPGFFAFRNSPRESHHEFSLAIVVGDPEPYSDSKWLFPPLPGARDEANEVAAMLGISALLGSGATKQTVARFLRSHPTIELVYLATHGLADPMDPLDASFLLMSDGRWPATEVQNLRLQNNPLVVLSACQTGLGRDFDVGTIGMARAWERAGAGAVVMSLWSVDDLSTRFLMTRFVNLARTLPADEALRQAMRLARTENGNPANWAGFAVFGAPAR